MQAPDEFPIKGLLRLFIVDDNRLIRDALSQMVGALEGVEVVGMAAGAVDAIRQIQTLQPDVIILDLQMPGRSGLHVLQTIREQGVKSVVMIFTAYSQEQYRLEAIRLGADFFFSKTLDNERLFDELTALARKIE